MTATTADASTKRGIPGFAQLQRIGRALMLPIASLPAAALLLRLGQADMLGADGLAKHASWLQPVADVMAAAGNALFNNLPLLFAVGVAVGYARKSDGSTALAAVIGYLVFTGVGDAMSPYVLGKPDEGQTQELVNYGVLGGLVIGIIAALLYQKYYRIKLPQALAFFGGRRFVPIITSFAAIVASVLMSLVYKWFDLGLTNLGKWVAHHDVLGGFVYGTANRLLVPLGLHHLLNFFPWFEFGSYTAADGQTYHGDINRFLHHDPTAGAFMTGFFPIMMFALPGAALAIIHTSKPQNRKIVAGIMGSAALVSFVTGVTEPLEFSFVYVAYPLYAIHAVLTGTSLALVNALGIKSGFGFSAGTIDYLLNFNIATKPLLLIPIGLAYGVIYYFIFRWVILKWKLRTPGREEDDANGQDSVLFDQPAETAAEKSDPAVKRAVESVVEGAGNRPGDGPSGGTGGTTA
ncbi:PTS sugar transporter subunit IIA [Luteimicrobium album]|uniref:PTS sugar transporter subunit IIA n=1 Tax=Luteimicrobium album TaxID=1054550 RepID=A0ABQ6HY92_9MICO|nr:PTS transporter subunit EIIC [Luteimicrobium album]GMA23470.1 PTS sugar transporter subunit IIA [Luteimicrobium album]